MPLLQKCNLHLAYSGCGNYTQLLLRTTTYEKEIFGVGSPVNIDIVDTKPSVIGSLMADEEEALSQLLNMGLQGSKVALGPDAPHVASAGARSERDLNRVKEELAAVTLKSKHTIHGGKAVKLVIEPLVRVEKLSTEDIARAKWRVKDKHCKQLSKNQKQQHKPCELKMRGQFQVAVHKLPNRKWKYYYKCKVGDCTATFSKMTAWNSCNEYRKILQTPLSYKNHLTLHKKCHFSCNRCDHKFIFCSELITHHSLH